MWIADMDFEAPAPIVEALQKRALHPNYGYTVRPDSYYKAMIDWLKRRQNWTIQKDWLCYSPGIVPAINFAIQAFTEPGEKVLIQSPVYYPFFAAVENNNRELAISELLCENQYYSMDFDDLEKQFADGVKMMILCSPHNPVGRVWTRQELEKLTDLLLKYQVRLVSDEIHSDIVFKEHQHCPIASLSPEIAAQTITCIAPSKTFNVAGLATSAIIISEEDVREKFRCKLGECGIGLGNIFGITALEAAYTQCEDWLEAMLDYLKINKDTLDKFLLENIPEIIPIRTDGTFLAWLDCRPLGLSPEELKKFMVDEAKLGLDEGAKFGPGGEGFMRMNIGCPHSVLETALEQLKTAVEKQRK